MYYWILEKFRKYFSVLNKKVRFKMYVWHNIYGWKKVFMPGMRNIVEATYILYIVTYILVW